jgi:ammonium transporter, Amt family
MSFRKFFAYLSVPVAVALHSAPAFAAEAAGSRPVSAGDTAFVLSSASLVLFMTVGLAFFYGGLVRRKNVLSVLLQCLFLMALIGIQWILFGYSLAFGPDRGGILGGLDWIGLRGVGLTPSRTYATTVPHQAFMIFQAMFAIITPGLIIGAFAERMKFSAFVIFSLLWSTIVYDPVCHWVWGAGGFLARMGVMDFAGGTVVHVNAGIAALVTALVLGKRAGYPERPIPPHNLPFALLGAGILWFGWFGFNAGSALSANGIATNAFVATNTAGAAAALTWAFIEWWRDKTPTLLGTATGAIAGLAAVTPASGFVGPMSAIAIGVGASVLGYIFVAAIKPWLGYDDSLDAFGVHGIGGIWGTLAVGLFATTAINPAGRNGLFFGNPAQLGVQAIGVGVTIAYSLVMTFIICKVVDALVGIRANAEDERIGLDLTQHHESGYTVLD